MIIIYCALSKYHLALFLLSWAETLEDLKQSNYLNNQLRLKLLFFRGLLSLIVIFGLGKSLDVIIFFR